MRKLFKETKAGFPMIIGVIVFVFVLGIALFTAYQRYLILKISEEEEVARQATRVENEMKRVLSQGFSGTQSLAFLVENYGVPKDFSGITKLLLKTNTSIDALELVDSTGVITHVYPIEGNQVLGFNILRDSIGKPGALKTIEKGEYYISGPIRLRQGGSGFVCRTPVYNKGKFSGFAAAVIKLSSLLSEIALDSLDQQGQFSYRLSKINEDGSEETFFSSKKEISDKALNHPITDYNGEWKLYVISNRNLALTGFFVLGVLGLFLSLLAGFYTFYMLERPAKLKALVDEKTSLLKESEQKFRTLVEHASDGIFLTDFHGGVLDANLRGVEMFGYRKEELLSKNLKDLAPQAELEKRPIQYSTLSIGQPILTERLLLKNDGTTFYGEVSAKKLNEDRILGIVRDVTARKELELIAQNNLEKFQKAFNSTTIGMAIFDDELKFVDANPYFLEIIGHSLDGILGRTIEQVGPIFKDESVKRKQAVTTLEEKGKVTSMELVIQKENGREIHLLTSAEVYSFKGKSYILATYIDRTEAKKAQQKTIESEEKYRLLVQNASDGIVLTDQKASFLEVNIKFCSMVGYTHEELMAMNVDQIIENNDLKTTPLRFAELNAGKTVQSKRILQKKDGSQITVELAVKKMPNGKLQGIVRDITEREKAEKEILALQSKMDAAIRIGKIGYWNWHIKTDEVDWSDRMYEIYDVDRGKPINTTLVKNLVHPDDLQMYDQVMTYKTTHKDDNSFTYRIVQRDKSIKHVLVQMEVKADEEGNPVKYEGTAMDITPGKEAEILLEKQNEELKKTNSELDSFVYSASHDLRAPLASLLGLVDIMKDEEEEPQKLLKLQMMESSITRLDGFIGDIIQYSRNKHLDMKVEKINFSTLIDRSLEDLWYLEKASKITFVKNIENNVAFYSDERRIAVLLNNIISNSIKYHDMEKTEPSIWIEVKTSQKEAIISIKDNGLGIAMENQDKIFNMFYRVSSEVMGSGIGLFIVKEILDKLGATVSLESSLGKGTRFTFNLPNTHP